MLTLLALLVVLQAPAARAYPPYIWTQQPTQGTDPSPRWRAPMSYDIHTKQMFMFGGHCAFSMCPTDMWTWAKSPGWAPLTTTGGPSFCPSAEMVYKSAAPRRTVLVCSHTGPLSSVELWEFDAITNTWSGTSPATSPPGRQDFALTYDTNNGVVVLFGGFANQGAILADTWTWDGSNWTQQSPANNPSPRYGMAFAYDQASGESIIVGGQGPTGVVADTWAYNGVNWTQRSAGGPLPPRWRARATYDSTHRQVLLHGGIDLATSTALADTWVWDGLLSTWTQHPTLLPARFNASMAYDPRTDHSVLFGGQYTSPLPGLAGDTWTYGLP